jgi:hypothetical protein
MYNRIFYAFSQDRWQAPCSCRMTSILMEVRKDKRKINRALLGIEPRPLAFSSNELPKASIVPLDYKATRVSS